MVRATRAYVGTENIVGRGGPKIVTGWGGSKNMASVRGTTSGDREGVGRETFSKNDRKFTF